MQRLGYETPFLNPQKNPSGTATRKQDGSEISKGTFNNRNQLTAQEPGGWMRVRGSTNEGASVKVKSNNSVSNSVSQTICVFKVTDKIHPLLTAKGIAGAGRGISGAWGEAV